MTDVTPGEDSGISFERMGAGLTFDWQIAGDGLVSRALNMSSKYFEVLLQHDGSSVAA